MPQIMVKAGGASEAVMLAERVNVADFETEHFRAQLLERLSWAVGDAHTVEQAHQDQHRQHLWARRLTISADGLDLRGAGR